MPGPTFFQQFGSQGTKPTRYAPLFINRHFTGLYTQRNPLRDPSDSVREKFYGGRPDALLAGVNVELTNRLTLARRPGLLPFSGTTYPTPPLSFYSFQKLSGGIDVIVDLAAQIYVDNQDGTKTLILNKAGGAGPSQFLGVGNTLYIGDGVDTVIWNDFGLGVPGNNNGNATNPSWNWGTATPTVPPTLAVTTAASATATWVASTVFSTMGFIVDLNGNVQQLIGVNADGTNPTSRLGTSGSGGPVWNQTPGGTTADGTVTWTNFGPIEQWKPLTLYNSADLGGVPGNPCIIYDPVTQCCFFTATPGSASGTSGTTKPLFQSTKDWNVHDPLASNSPPAVKWWSFAGTRGKVPPQWTPTTAYVAWGAGDHSTMCICEPTTVAAAYNPITNTFSQTVWLQVSNGHTSGAGTTEPPWAQGAGNITNDKQLQWVCQGSATRIINHNYTAWLGQGQLTFGVIKDSNNNMQVCTVGGTSSGTATGSITWATTYGAPTVDGQVTWTCVGNSMSWASSTQWYLPSKGFFAPSIAVPYGGATIIDTNNAVQSAIASGKSGGAAPTWQTVGLTTADGAGALVWYCQGPASTNSMSWTKGLIYAFSYASRTSTDFYNTTAPPGWPSPLGPPTGSGSGEISTASPLATITGANPGAVVTVSDSGSTDPAVDTIVIWRTADGGSTLFFLTEIPNPAPVNGKPGTWVWQDYQPDSALNTFIEAPVDHANDPPPIGFMPDAYHFGRIWGHVGNNVYFSGGPDTLTGDPNTSFPATNVFTFPAKVTRSISTPTGLIVFCVDATYLIAGGPQTITFFSQPLIPGTGLLFFYALDVQGNQIFLFSSDRQFLVIDPSAGESELGFAIGDTISTFNPASTYVSAHISGSADKALFVADGSTGWFRLNPNQAPESGPVWSVKANVVNGCQAVQSIETSPGVHNLLVGATTNNQPILKRDLTVFTDNGLAYPSNLKMGSLILAQPGQMAALGFITLDLQRVGTSPILSFLLDEVSGTFTSFAFYVSDPPELWGATGHPTTLFSNRYYFNAPMAAGADPPPAWCRHMQIGIDFGATDIVQNELLTLTVFGAHYQEQ